MIITSYKEWLHTIDNDSEDFTKDKDQLYDLTLEGYNCFNGATSADLTWRLGRAAYKVAAAADGSGDKHKWRKYLAESERMLRQAISLDDQIPESHSWLAIVLGKKTSIASVKERIAVGKEIRERLDRAISLGADDHMTYYAYGRWCYEVASLSWAERRIAGLLFDVPPESSFMDALKMFLKVEPHRPLWRSNNYWIARTSEKLKDYETSKKYVQKSVSIDSHDEEDVMHEQAITVLHQKYHNSWW